MCSVVCILYDLFLFVQKVAASNRKKKKAAEKKEFIMKAQKNTQTCDRQGERERWKARDGWSKKTEANEKEKSNSILEAREGLLSLSRSPFIIIFLSPH